MNATPDDTRIDDVQGIALGVHLPTYLGLVTGQTAGLAFDVALFTVAAVIFPASIVALSLPGAAVLNLIIAVNHRRDRYVAT